MVWGNTTTPHEELVWGNFLHTGKIVNDSYRVKYLDQEDIESLGFELIESTKSNYYGDLFSVKQDCKLGSLDFTTYRLLLGQQGRVQLTVIEDNSYGGDTKEMNFAIKNKSELKKILKQIGYE